MFSPGSTFYYWEENREEIYRSAPTRLRVRKRGRVRRWRRHVTEQNENAPECLSHGQGWKERFEQLIDSLSGKILPDREDLKTELASVVCSCDERDREKCKDAANRFGFTIGSNLPWNELFDRMKFTELYFHNILNSTQFTEEYVENYESEPYNDIVRGLLENRLNIFSLVQRCLFQNDLKAYRLLDVIRQYIQKPCQGVIQIPLPGEREEVLAWLVDIEKNDHINTVKTTFGCHLTTNSSVLANQLTLDLHATTANIQDLHEIQSYFVNPIGVKLKVDTSEVPTADVVDEQVKAADHADVNEAPEEPNGRESVDSSNNASVPLGENSSDGVGEVKNQPDTQSADSKDNETLFLPPDKENGMAPSEVNGNGISHTGNNTIVLELQESSTASPKQLSEHSSEAEVAGSKTEDSRKILATEETIQIGSSYGHTDGSVSVNNTVDQNTESLILN